MIRDKQILYMLIILREAKSKFTLEEFKKFYDKLK